MYGRIKKFGYCCALTLLTTSVSGEPATLPDRQEMAVRHVLYEFWQDRHRAAYEAAAQYRLKGLGSPRLQLTQASASLEMGYLALGRALIDDLQAGSLLPGNQLRLRLYLARDAYRRRDWVLLQTELDRATEVMTRDPQVASLALEEPYYHYLHAESARLKGDLEQASSYLEALPAGAKLLPYGRFNLAVSYKTAGEWSAAMTQLQHIIETPPVNLEQFRLAERAQLALSDVLIEQANAAAAQQSLARVTVDGQYGPRALAQLAGLKLQIGEYQAAANIWSYLLEHYPNHPAAVHGSAGLGYALLKLEAEAAAYGAFETGIKHINGRRQQLAAFRPELSKALETPRWILEPDESETHFLSWMARGLGHDEWVAWLANDEVQSIARRWQALNTSYMGLSQNRQDLDILLMVDAEQQRRVRAAKVSMRETKLDTTVQQIDASLALEIQRLRNDSPDLTDDLDAYQKPLERDWLAEVSRLEQHPAAAKFKARIERLKGRVLYQIYDDLPHRKQQLLNQLESQQREVRIALSRTQRIYEAEQALSLAGSVSQQIHQLARDNSALLLIAENELGLVQQQLIASVMSFLDASEQTLIAQQNGLEYDIARLMDKRFVAERQP